MPTIDLPTLLFLSTVLFGLMSVTFFVTWRQDPRRNRAMAYWSLAHALAVPSCSLLALRGHVPDWASIGLSNAGVILAYGLLWGGMRVFEGRRAPVAMIAAGAAIWVVGCQIPALYGSFSARVSLVSLLVATEVAMTALLVWQRRDVEPLPTRRIAAGVIGLVAFTHLMRLGMSLGGPPIPDYTKLGAGWIGFVAVQIMLQSVIAGYVLVALVKERGEFLQRQTAEIDSLTGIFTRRAFLDRAGRRLADDPSRGALLIFDLDRFKAINDTHGHAAGDHVLTVFAKVVNDRLGESDIFGRHGGEEFVLFLGDADIVAAWRVAEQIRHDFAGLDIRHEGRPIEATVSVGVAAVPLVSPDLDRLLSSADAGLYAAKNAGRDRVETAEVPRSGDHAAA